MVRKKVTPETVEEMRSLREEGLSYGKIANKLGLTPMTVYNHLQKKEEHEFIGKLKKWEPVHRMATKNEVSIDKVGIDIFAWAAGHFKGHKGADLYVDDKTSLLGIKPVAKGQRSLISKAEGRGFFVSCTALMGQAGVNERRKVPAEWDEEEKMLVVHLKERRGRKPAGRPR